MAWLGIWEAAILGLSRVSFSSVRFICLSPHPRRQEALCEQQETWASFSCAPANQLACYHEGQMHMNMEHRPSFFCSVCQAMNPLILFYPNLKGSRGAWRERGLWTLHLQGCGVQNCQLPKDIPESNGISFYFLVEAARFRDLSTHPTLQATVKLCHLIKVKGGRLRHKRWHKPRRQQV